MTQELLDSIPLNEWDAMIVEPKDLKPDEWYIVTGGSKRGIIFGEAFRFKPSPDIKFYPLYPVLQEVHEAMEEGQPSMNHAYCENCGWVKEDVGFRHCHHCWESDNVSREAKQESEDNNDLIRAGIL